MLKTDLRIRSNVPITDEVALLMYIILYRGIFRRVKVLFSKEKLFSWLLISSDLKSVRFNSLLPCSTHALPDYIHVGRGRLLFFTHVGN